MPSTTIIVSHRGPGPLAACLEAVCAFTDRETPLVVVDATGGRDRQARDGVPVERAARLRIVAGRPGEGPVKACNRALQACDSRQAVVLDSTAIVGDRWLGRVLACLDRAPRAGMIGPLTACHFAGLPVSDARATEASREPYNRHRRIAVSTPDPLCLVMERALLSKLGFLDEAFDSVPAALVDLCLRCELAGYRNYLAGDVFVKNADGRLSAGVWKKAVHNRWAGVDPESGRRRHYEALKLSRRARRAYHREAADHAVELYLQGIGLYPEEPRLYLDLAAMLAETGRYPDALQALQEMPGGADSTTGQFIYGLCCKGMERADEAAAAVARIFELDGKSAAGWWLKGALLAEKGEPDRAGEALLTSISCDPGYGPGYTALGNLRWNRDGGGDALALLERGFALAPESGDAMTAYHTAISRRQDYLRAIPVFWGAVAACRSSRRLRYLLIDVLLKAGETPTAMGAIESLLVDFGPEEGALSAALAVRNQLGPLELKAPGGGGGTLAFCLIVRDEEQDLPRCLDSIKMVADEIIVVDTGSRDRTRDIAAVFGARVFNFEWCDDFSAAKNFAAGQAEADWIFSIDADEVLSPLDHEALLELVGSAKNGPLAYAVTTRNYLKTMDVIGWQSNDGRYPEEAGLGWIPSEKVRLFPNDRQVRFAYPVHEMVEPSLEKAGITILACAIPVHHYGKLDPARSREKGEAYFQIGIRKLEAMQTSTTGIRELAVQAQVLGHYQEAVQLWERLSVIEPGQAHTYINLASAHLELGDYAQAQDAAEEARRLDPAVKEGHFNHALSLLYAGDARGAAAVLEKLADRHPGYIAARFMLAAAYCCAGESRRATEIITGLRRTQLAAGLPAALRHLADGLERAGRDRDRYRSRILELAVRVSGPPAGTP